MSQQEPTQRWLSPAAGNELVIKKECQTKIRLIITFITLAIPVRNERGGLYFTLSRLQPLPRLTPSNSPRHLRRSAFIYKEGRGTSRGVDCARAERLGVIPKARKTKKRREARGDRKKGGTRKDGGLVAGLRRIRGCRSNKSGGYI